MHLVYGLGVATSVSASFVISAEMAASVAFRSGVCGSASCVSSTEIAVKVTFKSGVGVGVGTPPV